MHLTQDDVREILALLDGSAFTELRLETDRFKLTLRRTTAAGWTQEEQPTGARQRPETPTAASDAAVDGLIDIRAPIIGTFYAAPSPGAPPFVMIGSTVSADTVVAIIETMKLMNSVPAGARGEIVAICARDGALVEHAQVLMRLRPERA